MDISQFMITDEKWDAMTDEQRLEAIRNGDLNSEQMRKVRREGSEEMKSALEEYLANRPNPIESISAAFKTKPLSERMAEYLSPKYDLPAIHLPRLPSSKEIHSYESAEDLIERLQQRYELWTKALPETLQPVIYAVLANGMAIRVLELSREGHNGVAIDGLIEETQTRCLVVAHQASLQLLCMAEAAEQKSQRRSIGFHSGRETEPSGVEQES